MFFRDIAGQVPIKEQLLNMIKHGRISHALMFIGPDGNGKLALAIAFVKFLFCTDKKENDSCGICPSCKKVEKLIHPDLHFVFPVVKTKKIAKPTSNDFIDQWREFISKMPYHGFNEWLNILNPDNQQAGIFTQESTEILRKLSFKPYESEYKAMIIWMPDKMNLTCSNKLLKILEEPPENTVFILVTDNINKIITTIRSRTQLITIPKIRYQDMNDCLKEKYNFAEERIQEIIRVSDGNFLKAEEIIKAGFDENTSDLFDRFTLLMRLSYGIKIQELIDFSESISFEGREYQKNFLEYALRMLRENFILNITKDSDDPITYLTDKERQFSNNFSKYINKNNIFEIYNELTEAYNHIERNGYGKLVFLDLALKMVRFLKLTDSKNSNVLT
jgi:DNA polymerase-3 subunit delta'